MSQSRTAIISDSVVQGQESDRCTSPRKKETEHSISKQGSLRKGLAYFFVIIGMFAILGVYIAVFIYRGNSPNVSSENKQENSSNQRKLQQTVTSSQPHPSVIPIFNGKVVSTGNQFANKNFLKKRHAQVVVVNQRSRSKLRQELTQNTVSRPNYVSGNTRLKRYNKRSARTQIPTMQSSYSKHSSLGYKNNADLMRGNERFNNFKKNFIATRRAVDARNPFPHHAKLSHRRRQAASRGVTFNRSRFIL